MPPQAPFESEEKCFKTFRVKLRIYVQGNCLVTKATLEVSAPPCLCEKVVIRQKKTLMQTHMRVFFLCVRVLRMQK